jgi:hypothetical protein
MLKQLLRISPEICKIHFLSDASFKITQQICEPGRTTNNIVTKMVDIKSGNLLVEKYVKGGIIDSATRISVPRPYVKDRVTAYIAGQMN